MRSKPDSTLFKHPFSRKYWRLAAKECSDVRMLCIAAVLTALRIAVKSASVPLGPNLYLTFGFIVNSVGSMVYGPVMAILASAVSDTVGAVLFPTGTYFFPFIFVEISGGLIFALFYYRADITPMRVLWGRFCVTLFCNILLSPIITYYYNWYIMGKSYEILSLPRMIKNWALFPLQSLIILVLFRSVLPFLNSRRLTYTSQTDIHMSRREWLTMAVMLIISAAAVVLYYVWRGLR